MNNNQNKTVFLIGAGFSKCAGLPLNNDLPSEITESVFKKAQANTHLELNERLSPLEAIKDKDYHTTLPGLYLKQVAMNSKRKDFNTFIERCTSLPDDINEEWRSVFESWYMTNGTIRSDVEEGIKAILERPPSRTDYIDNLVKYCNETGSPIYSTNFDTLIEQACNRLGLEPDVAATFSRPTHNSKANFKIYKINGSIDWSINPEIKDLHLTQYPVVYERNYNSSGSQNIALTYQSKLATMATAMPILIQLHEDFRHYKKIVAIGTSFQDLQINSVIYFLLHNNDYMLDVVTPHELPVNIDYFSYSINKKSMCNRITHINMTASEYSNLLV